MYPKENVIARLEFELAYYNSAVQRFNNYTTRNSPHSAVSLFYKPGRQTVDFLLI